MSHICEYECTDKKRLMRCWFASKKSAIAFTSGSENACRPANVSQHECVQSSAPLKELLTETARIYSIRLKGILGTAKIFPYNRLKCVVNLVKCIKKCSLTDFPYKRFPYDR